MTDERDARGEKVRLILAYVDSEGYTSIKRVAESLTAMGYPTIPSLVRYAMKVYRPDVYDAGKARNRVAAGNRRGAGDVH